MIGQQQFAVFYQFKLSRGWGKRETDIKLGLFGKK
jgi:hypothetical protein